MRHVLQWNINKDKKYLPFRFLFHHIDNIFYYSFVYYFIKTCFLKSQQSIKAPLSNKSILRLMCKFEVTKTKMLVFITAGFFKRNIHILPNFYAQFLWEVQKSRAMNNRLSNGSLKDWYLFNIKRRILNTYREEDKGVNS